jgi:hypothetical protein
VAGLDASSGVLKSSPAELSSTPAAEGAVAWPGVVSTPPVADEQGAAASAEAPTFSFWTIWSIIALSAA